MNYSQLLYRFQIGGPDWVLKTALGAMKSTVTHAFSAAPPFSDPPSNGNPKVLYLHSGWAIESVGKLWLSDQQSCHVTFQKTGSKSLAPSCLENYDLIWYGYSSLYSQYPLSLNRAIIAVHDPAELFPERSDWKENPLLRREHQERLSGAKAVVVISREMQEILSGNGISSSRLPTRSTLPLRAVETIPDRDTFRFLGVGRIYRRKNFEQFRRIAAAVSKRGIPSYLKCDHFASDMDTYIKLLDRFPVYVCTSFQEGGPLPVMDAMQRGAVPVCAPVGQALEIIRHGENGFICRTDEDFIEVIARLAADPALLKDMRHRALASIASSRAENIVRAAVRNFLSSVMPTLRKS